MGESEQLQKKNELDYVKVLNAVRELPFYVGKNLLVDFLKGNIKNRSVRNNNLNAIRYFGSLDYNEEKIRGIIENLINNNLIELAKSPSNKFLKILKLTEKGKREIFNPTLNKKKLKNNFDIPETKITENDRKIFRELDFYLKNYNDNQKKAIISDSEKILCIAGAGSGKTTVLTKRIEFLIKYMSVNPDKILAVTFTRKAKQEMEERLSGLGIKTNVETFNSFSEKILRKNWNTIYNRRVRVINYGNKIMAVMSALNSIGMKIDDALDLYFSKSQRKNKTKEELSNLFMNDCFSVLDFFKVKKQEITDFSGFIEPEKYKTAKMIYNIVRHLDSQMKILGLRDFTDQIVDTINFFKNNQIPEFEHVLVDEYQDVNAMQIELLDLLNSKNLFVVGDPRQSIFGWRGSDIRYILKFQEKYKDCDIITLTRNYRSNKHIVDLINSSIRDMKLPDLESNFQADKEIKLLKFENEELEYKFVLNKIISSEIPRNEIFVLARTNRQVNEISSLMKQKNIKHVVKTDENNNISAKKEDLTVATIHSIKGLEAEMVFVIGCNELNFPCKASDHPVIEMIKLEDYDREEEEKRLFYVAMSRAKNKLYLTYSGKKPTYFITSEMMDVIEN
ncbi:AAA family ATPase [Candidatus Pacearchaeota archaeon]|nr:AAA family ATPase [Candidatus Pacearchaeota archaeon]MBD3282964.1 AAA family ATPase [Candidatus Pacearchaeota archaeon]